MSGQGSWHSGLPGSSANWVSKTLEPGSFVTLSQLLLPWNGAHATCLAMAFLCLKAAPVTWKWVLGTGDL